MTDTITKECDGCGKQRRDVRSCGRDANGDPDAPDLCFFCRKEAQRKLYPEEPEHGHTCCCAECRSERDA